MSEAVACDVCGAVGSQREMHPVEDGRLPALKWHGRSLPNILYVERGMVGTVELTYTIRGGLEDICGDCLDDFMDQFLDALREAP